MRVSEAGDVNARMYSIRRNVLYAVMSHTKSHVYNIINFKKTEKKFYQRTHFANTQL